MSSATTATPRGVATALFEALNRHDLDAAMAMDHADVIADFVAVRVFHGVYDGLAFARRIGRAAK